MPRSNRNEPGSGSGSSVAGRAVRRAWPLLLAGAAAVVAPSCANAGTSSSGTSSTPISATIPPGYAGSVAPDQMPVTTPAAGIGDVPSAPTSVQPENQALCEEVQRTQGLFSGPAGVDDATALQQMKATFARMVEVAPSSIKPEIQGMSNAIQGMSSLDDVDRLTDPGFTANQERFAQFVLNSCGFQLVG